MNKERTFEESIGLLEEIIAKLVNQNTSLEEAMSLFKQGVELSDVCAKKLEDVKQSVSVLIEKNGEVQKEEFVTENE